MKWNSGRSCYGNWFTPTPSSAYSALSSQNIAKFQYQNSAKIKYIRYQFYGSHPSGLVKKRAYIFDGVGNFYNKEWDLADLYQKDKKDQDLAYGRGKEFCWYHVELPKANDKLSQSAQYLIGVLCPPLTLQDILSLVSNGPFCAHVDGKLVFRVNSPGPASSDFTFRIAARVTEDSVITVSLGRVPRLGFSRTGERESLLSEIPSVESPTYFRGQKNERSGIVIREHVLEFLLTMNPVPRSVSNLIVHIIDTHVDQLQDLVTKLELELDSMELDFDKGGFALKKQMLDDRRFPKLHLNLQRLLQVIAHGEQVFPRVKEKCSSKRWFANEDINSPEELIGRLRRLKENVDFIVNRVTAIQASLDSWQSEQINRKLYFRSFQLYSSLYPSSQEVSNLILQSLLLSIFIDKCGFELWTLHAAFGMNVGGVPWTVKGQPDHQNGFRNVLLLCVAMLFLVLLCFLFPALYSRLETWRKKSVLGRSWSINKKSLLRKIADQDKGGYLRI